MNQDYSDALIEKLNEIYILACQEYESKHLNRKEETQQLELLEKARNKK
jgi:hypothetical protein